MSRSSIEWTEVSWNPVIGCSKTSPGCDRCYAIGQAHRNTAMQEARPDLRVRAYVPALTSDRNFGIGEKDIDWTGEVRCLPERLGDPLRWKAPRRVFVNSMSDLFHHKVPLQFVLDVWSVMAQSPQHTFQVLTKRPKRMSKIVDAIAWDGGVLGEPWRAYAWPGSYEDENGDVWDVDYLDLDGGGEEPLPNVWLGVSIESASYTFRLEHLRATPAAVRWVSFEPLLGPLGDLDLTGIDWAVVGGESGKGARPMHPDWAREIRDQCIDQGVAFFFKQWGNWRPRWDNERDDLPGMTTMQGPVTEARMVRERSKNFDGHDLLDGQQWHQYPEEAS